MQTGGWSVCDPAVLSQRHVLQVHDACVAQACNCKSGGRSHVYVDYLTAPTGSLLSTGPCHFLQFSHRVLCWPWCERQHQACMHALASRPDCAGVE